MSQTAADAAFAIALAAVQSGRAGEAQSALDRAIGADPRHVDALHLRARLALQAGDAAAAATLLERAVALQPRATVLRNDLGVALRFLGRDADAARVFESALLTAQNDAEAWHNLGMTRRKLGDLRGAAAALERAARFGVRPASLAALGMVREEQGDPAGALTAFRQAAALAPEQPDMQRNLAVALGKAGQAEEAAGAFESYLRLKPDDAPARADYGLILARLGRRDAARTQLNQALQLAPNHLPALRTLASVVDRADARALLERALALAPDDAETLLQYAELCRVAGDFARAEQAIARALARKPDEPDLHNQQALIALASGNAAKAEAAARAALLLAPDAPEFHVSLGAALWEQRKMDEAKQHIDRVLAQAPHIVEAHLFAASFAQLAGDAEGARRGYARAVELDPTHAAAHSNMLFSSQYRERWDAAETRAEHEAWDRQHGDPYRAHWTTSVADPDPARRLRVGFVSYDFNRHPVGFFTLGLLRELDRSQITPVCFNTNHKPDDVTQALRATGAEWLDCVAQPDAAVDAQIRERRIDILIDLGGHTAFNRLPVFARKPAPIQMTWAGYVGTTGLAAMDWLIADRFHAPPEFAADHRERVLRLPDGYVCYAPPAYAPAVTPPPMLAGGAVTFAAFHNPAKIGPGAIALWARVLAALPGSRIMLKYRGLDAASSRARLETAFAAHGIAGERLVLEGSSPHEELLARYGQADIALDSLPYSGGLTTLEALWMGVPVITLPGRRFCSRHSLSHLSNAGLAELVARDAEDYVAKAVALARDQQRLAALRAGLRARLRESPVCDATRFARNFATAMRQAWHARVLA
jgi:predicted O-linked N-acetylglucosamine transferase (SPINDLY family)